VNGQVAPAGGRVLGAGTCIVLIAAGAAVRFALSAGSPHGLNVPVTSTVLILTGVLGLLLTLLVPGPLNPARRRAGPRGRDSGAAVLVRAENASTWVSCRWRRSLAGTGSSRRYESGPGSRAAFPACAG
jgi:hypothetical protein